MSETPVSIGETPASIPIEEGCDGVCNEGSDLIGMVLVILSGFALVAGLMSSLVNSWTNYLAKAFRQRDSIAKEQTYPPGRDPFYLIYSLQFVATILATDRGQVPESLRHYVDKFQWANFQIKFENNSHLRRTCDVVVRDEVFGTAVVCSAIFFGSFFLREIAKFLITRWSKGQTGIRNSPAFLCLGHWELVWFFIMVFGWSITAGKAIRSDCVGWEIIGMTILVFLPVAGLCIIHVMVKFAVEYEPVVVFERSKDHPVLSSIVGLSELYLPYHGCAGRWKMLPGTNWPYFLQVFSKYMETYRQDLYFYGSLVLLKKICTGLIYGVSKPTTASLLYCVVNVMEALTLILTQPQVEFKLYLRAVLQSVVMFIVAALLVAHAYDACSDAVLTLSTIILTSLLLFVAIVDQFFTASEELRGAAEHTHLLRQPPAHLDLPGRLLRVRSDAGDSDSSHKHAGGPRTRDAELLLEGVHAGLRGVPLEEEWRRGSMSGNSRALDSEDDGAAVRRREGRGSSQAAIAISSMPASQGTISLARRLRDMDLGFDMAQRTETKVAMDRKQMQGVRDRLVAMGHWYNPSADTRAIAEEPRSSTMRIKSPWDPVLGPRATPGEGAGAGAAARYRDLPAGLKLGEMEELPLSEAGVAGTGAGTGTGPRDSNLNLNSGARPAAAPVSGPPFAMPWSARIQRALNFQVDGAGEEPEREEGLEQPEPERETLSESSDSGHGPLAANSNSIASDLVALAQAKRAPPPPPPRGRVPGSLPGPGPGALAAAAERDVAAPSARREKTGGSGAPAQGQAEGDERAPAPAQAQAGADSGAQAQAQAQGAHRSKVKPEGDMAERAELDGEGGLAAQAGARGVEGGTQRMVGEGIRLARKGSGSAASAASGMEAEAEERERRRRSMAERVAESKRRMGTLQLQVKRGGGIASGAEQEQGEEEERGVDGG